MLRVLKKFSEIILSYKVTKFEQFGQFFKLRAGVELIDRSKLFIRETVVDKTNRKYALPLAGPERKIAHSLG